MEFPQRANKAQKMKVTRPAHLKKDAHRIKRWMENAGFKKVVITGQRANWLVVTNGDLSCLAKFASVEAKYEGKR
jgi:hypothetical protein